MKNSSHAAVIAAAATIAGAIDLTKFNPRFDDASGGQQAGASQQQQASQGQQQPAASGEQGGQQSAAPVVQSTVALRTEFNRLREEALGVADAAATANRSLTPAEQAANQTRFDRMNVIDAVIVERNRFASRALVNDIAGPAGGEISAGDSIQRPSDPPGRDQFQRSLGAASDQADIRVGDDLRFAQHVAACNHFIRTGELRHNNFVLTTGGGTAVLVPTTIGTPLVVKRIANPIRAALVARGFRPIVTSDTAPITIPIFDDTANTADVIAQDNTSENNKDPSTTSLSLGSLLYDSGTVWSSNTLLNSLSFDLLAYLTPMLSARIDYKQLTAWTTSLTTTGVVGVTTASQTGVTYNELLNWQHSVPVRRRRSGVFFLADGLMRALRGMVDGQGHPIYQESLRDEEPNRLLGWPVFVSEELASPAANAKSGVAVAAEGLHIRDISNRRVARYVNIPTHPDQFGVREFANGDFAFEADCVRVLRHAA